MANYMNQPYHRKPYSDSTLMNMKKRELIEIIRDYEHNYAALYDTHEISVKQAEHIVKELEQKLSEKPVSDIRPVIRREDSEHYYAYPDDYRTCHENYDVDGCSKMVSTIDYCSRAERRK